MALHVDVISDVICPWCYVGKRRLEKAIAALGWQVVVRWLPSQLNPAMPKEGISRREYRTNKFGSWERSRELDARVVAVGQAEGIRFAFGRIERTPNTLDAHRLVGLAGGARRAGCGRGGAVPGLLGQPIGPRPSPTGAPAG
jgi:predicted DsbA family dithiol-disulfide isomerase